PYNSTCFIPALCKKQKAYHWRIFTPANNQEIWPLQWWIIAPAFSCAETFSKMGKRKYNGLNESS
ncbi:hypothetical protein, partial [Sneathiella sp.]|uniref:hypothetical protein n=1 Tax=Sneathiella sp. TaxID=1964365 RepID=UPI0035675B80